MSIVLMELRRTALPAPTEVWSHTWDITLTWRSAHESHEWANDSDELVEIVRRLALDPRIIGYRYERRDLLDMSAAPQICFGCQAPYAVVEPRRWWRPCGCGGHHVYRCTTCDHRQLYPETALTCG